MEKYTGDDENEIFITGAREERNKKRRWVNYESGTSCERCGRDFSNMPWQGSWGLCKTCDEDLEFEVGNSDDLFISYLGM